jgi:hypothetical protein
MAGGMSRGRGGVPMSERVKLGGDPAGTCPARHCWVAGGVDQGTAAPPAADSGRRPGLLLEWRPRPGGGWQGRVVYPARLRPDQWVLVEEWLDAELLTPR